MIQPTELLAAQGQSFTIWRSYNRYGLTLGSGLPLSKLFHQSGHRFDCGSGSHLQGLSTKEAVPATTLDT